MRWKNLVKSIKSKTVADTIAIAALVFAVSLIGFHFYQVNTKAPFVETVEITDPVQLTKKEYKIGEVVQGFFEGERYVSRPVIFNRTLVCEDFRAILDPVRVENPPVGPFEGASPIITLEDGITITDQGLWPMKSCEIIFSNQTVVRKYILGGEELQSDQSYRTTEFDIVE